MKIGIDLGSKTCEIAYINGNDVELIINSQEGNSHIISSNILMEDNQFKCGNIAKENIFIKPESVIENIKKCLEEKEVRLGDKVFKSEYILGVLGKRLKEISEYNLNIEVKECIVAIPSGLTIEKRKIIRDAFLISGFESVKLINEAIAASLSESLKKGIGGKFLVYDLGAESLKLNIVDIANAKYTNIGYLESKEISSNKLIKILYDAIINLFETSVNRKIDINNKVLIAQIQNAIENAIIELSFSDIANIFIPNISNDENNNALDLNLELSRADFEYLIGENLNKAKQLVFKILKENNLVVTDIDFVIQIGGASKIPLVNKSLVDLMGDSTKVIKNEENPIARGAILSSKEKNESFVVNSEVIQNSIGVEITDGLFDKILEAKTILPAIKSKKYKTVKDEQEIVEVKIFKGDSDNISENIFIDSFDLEGVKKDKKGKQIIEIELIYNNIGELNIQSTILESNIVVNKSITTEGLNLTEINKYKNMLDKESISDEFIYDDFNDKNIISEEEERLFKLEEERFEREQEIIRKKEQELQEKLEYERIEKERKLVEERERQERERQEEENRIKLQREKEQEEMERIKRLEEQQRQNDRAVNNVEDKGESKTVELKLFNNIQKNNDEIAGSNNSIETKVDNKESNIVKEELQVDEVKVDTSELIEEYDPSRDGEIYDDLARLMEYYKGISPQLDAETKEEANQLIGDLVALIKRDNFREARAKENKIIELIYRG